MHCSHAISLNLFVFWKLSISMQRKREGRTNECVELAKLPSHENVEVINCGRTYRYVVAFASTGHIYGQPHVDKSVANAGKDDIAILWGQELQKFRLKCHGDLQGMLHTNVYGSRPRHYNKMHTFTLYIIR